MSLRRSPAGGWWPFCVWTHNNVREWRQRVHECMKWLQQSSPRAPGGVWVSNQPQTFASSFVFKKGTFVNTPELACTYSLLPHPELWSKRSLLWNILCLVFLTVILRPPNGHKDSRTQCLCSRVILTWVPALCRDFLRKSCSGWSRMSHSSRINPPQTPPPPRTL